MAWSSRIARTRLTAPCQLRNAPAKIATVVAGRSNGGAPAASGRNRSVSAPHSSAHDLSRRRVPRKNRGARRDDEVGASADALAPPAHGLDDERAVDARLGRPRVIDDRRVDLEHRPGAGRGRRHHAFAAEVVVALHHDRRLERWRRCAGPRRCASTAAASRQTAAPSESSAPGSTRGRRKRPVARRHEHVDFVPEGREPLGHRGDVHRPAGRAGHGLVDGAVENPHGSGNKKGLKAQGSGLKGKHADLNRAACSCLSPEP